ncbi:zinc finger protein 37-like [Ylistrum balloti]|uniref:zinc finger protein 37-like n=1 Tax=Ylistrum balloti TaxID=509963 RepID=UPI002905ABFA|nr:zinc finger protein 37-like [Ylistrum balloti]
MTDQETLKSPSHVTYLASSLYQLQQQGHLCDCTIQTSQASINVHQVVLLASGSPYFRKQLCTEVKDDSVSQSHSVLVKDYDFFDVQTVIRFLYTGEMHLTTCSIEKILALCSLLGLEKATKLCHEFRQKNKCSINRETVNESIHFGTDPAIVNDVRPSEGIVMMPRHMFHNDRDSVATITTEKPGRPPSTGSKVESPMVEKNCHKSTDSQVKTFCKFEEMHQKDSGSLLSTKVTGSAAQNLKPNHQFTLRSEAKSQKARLGIQKSSRMKTALRNGNNKDLKEVKRREKQLKRKGKTLQEIVPDHVDRRQAKTTRHTPKKKTPDCDNQEKLCQNSNITKILPKTGKNSNVSQAFKTTVCNSDTDSRLEDEKQKKPFVLNFCRFCRIKFKDKEKFQEHKKQLHLFTCDVCGWSSNRGLNLASHKYNQHGIHHRPDKYPLHQCDHAGCGFKSILKHNITVHRKIHSKERQFQCDLCNASFKYKSQLICHRKTHDPDNLSFRCNVCEKAFPRQSLLNAHTKNVHEQNELCHLCPWKSSSRRELHIHLYRVHNTPLPKNFKIFQCHHCDYYTFTSISYRSHLDLHSDNNYKCKECGKLLKTEMRLYVHERKHKAEVKLINCSYPDCDYKAKSKATLKIHQDAKHSDYKPFQCHICGFRCKLKGNLDKHLRNRHKMEVMTTTKLWDKVMKTGQGYNSIVDRLKSFKYKGAIGMANEGDIEIEPETNLEHGKEIVQNNCHVVSTSFSELNAVVNEIANTSSEQCVSDGHYRQDNKCLVKETEIPTRNRRTQKLTTVEEKCNLEQHLITDNNIMYSNIDISLSTNESDFVGTEQQFVLGFSPNI